MKNRILKIRWSSFSWRNYMNRTTALGNTKRSLLTKTTLRKKPLNMPIKIVNISTTLLCDSGSACSIFNRSILSQVVKGIPHAFWIKGNVSLHFRTFWNEPIRIEGKVRAPIASNSWTSISAAFTVAADALNYLISWYLFDQLGLAVTQPSPSPGNQINTFSLSSEFKKHIAQNLPTLISRMGRPKTDVAKSIFNKISNLDIKRLDACLLTFKIKLILNSKSY